MMVNRIVKSSCGAATLLAAIYGADPQEVKYHLGLPTKQIRCSGCGKLLLRKSRSGYCPDCWHESQYIYVACDECGKLVKRKVATIISRANDIHGRYKGHAFCNRVCLGGWVGKRYGFGVHPNRGGKKRKYDYAAVWQKHLETGYGCRRLSRLLSIPEDIVSYILAKKAD